MATAEASKEAYSISPSVGTGTQDVIISLSKNTGDKRTYTLTAKTASGKTATLTVVQEASATGAPIVLQYTGTAIPASYVGKTIYVGDGKGSVEYYMEYGKISWISSSKIEIDVSGYTKSDIQGIYEDLSWGDLCEYDELYFGISSGDDPEASWTPIFKCVDNGDYATTSNNLAESINASYGGTSATIVCTSLIVLPSVIHRQLFMWGGPFCVGTTEYIIQQYWSTIYVVFSDGAGNEVSLNGDPYMRGYEYQGIQINYLEYDQLSAFYNTMSGSSYTLTVSNSSGEQLYSIKLDKSTLLQFRNNSWDSYGSGDIEWVFKKKFVSFMGTLYVDASAILSDGVIGLFVETNTGTDYLVSVTQYRYTGKEVVNLLGDNPFTIEIAPQEYFSSIKIATAAEEGTDVEDINTWDYIVTSIQGNNGFNAHVQARERDDEIIMDTQTEIDSDSLIFIDDLKCSDESIVEFSEMDEDDIYYMLYA